MKSSVYVKLAFTFSQSGKIKIIYLMVIVNKSYLINRNYVKNMCHQSIDENTTNTILVLLNSSIFSNFQCN